MEAGPTGSFSQRAGTIGGTVLVMVLQFGEVLKTMILAAVGAIVSFGVSMLLKWLVRKCKSSKS